MLGYLAIVAQSMAVPMIYVSHQADEIAGLCDEVIVLHQGQVQAREAP